MLLFNFLAFLLLLGKQPSANPKLMGWTNTETIEKQLALILPKYPEISAQNIVVRKRKQLIPLTSVPSAWNMFRQKRNWKYNINLSTESSFSKLNKIIYDSLSYNAQLGVLAHEISHVADFQTHSRWYLLEILFGHLSKKKMDRFEFETDHIAIKHGFGRYLKVWSAEVQQKFNPTKIETDTERPQNERYMSPATIEKYLLQYPEIYENTSELK
jgi:hypothetical protein